MMAGKNLWVETIGNQTKVGLTATAQDDLGSIGFASLPKVGTEIQKGDEVVELEAEKTVVEYESPVNGRVVEVNEEGLKNTKLLDVECAWLFTVEND